MCGGNIADTVASVDKVMTELRLVRELRRGMLRRSFAKATLVRLAGAAVCASGLAIAGVGTVGNPTIFGARLAATYTCTPEEECADDSVNGMVPTTVARYGGNDCSFITGTRDPSLDYWHFVIDPRQGWDFTDASQFVAVVNGVPMTGSAISATLTHGGSQLYISSAAGAELDWAFIPDSGTNETSEYEPPGQGEGFDFVLSSTCAATVPTTTVTPTPVPTTTVTPTPATSKPTTSGQGSGVLAISTSTPSTGADVGFGTGLLLVIGGTGLVLGAGRLSRRRK
jgi:hypothetical protein